MRDRGWYCASKICATHNYSLTAPKCSSCAMLNPGRMWDPELVDSYHVPSVDRSAPPAGYTAGYPSSRDVGVGHRRQGMIFRPHQVRRRHEQILARALAIGTFAVQTVPTDAVSTALAVTGTSAGFSLMVLVKWLSVAYVGYETKRVVAHTANGAIDLSDTIYISLMTGWFWIEETVQ